MGYRMSGKNDYGLDMRMRLIVVIEQVSCVIPYEIYRPLATILSAHTNYTISVILIKFRVFYINQ